MTDRHAASERAGSMRVATRWTSARKVAALASAVVLTVATLVAQAQQRVDWDALRPPAGEVHDPFAAMSDSQIDALRELALSRVLERRGVPVGETVLQRRAVLSAALRAQGIDPESALAARDRLIETRRAATERGAPEQDGRHVVIDGYLVPVAGDGTGTEHLLVSRIGACSHDGVAAANQVVRVRSLRPVSSSAAYAPGSVRGVLRVRDEVSLVYLVDGVLRVPSAYALDDAEVHAVPRDASADR
jgi:hypothetical protein